MLTKRTFPCFCALALLFFAFLGPVFGQKNLNLRFNPPATPGFTMQYRITKNTVSKMVFSGDVEQEKSLEITEYSVRLDTIYQNKTYAWSLRILRMKQQEGKNVRDSDAPKTEFDAIFWKRLLQNDIRLYADSLGRVYKTEGISSLMDSLQQDLSFLPNASELLQGAGAFLSDSSILELSKELWGYFPAFPVKKGARWQEETKVGPNNCMQKTTQFELVSLEAKKAKIATQVKIENVPGKLWEQDMVGYHFRYDLVTHATGTLWLSQPDGMLKKSETTLDQKGKMYMTGGPTDANQVIDLDNHITILIERL